MCFAGEDGFKQCVAQGCYGGKYDWPDKAWAEYQNSKVCPSYDRAKVELVFSSAPRCHGALGGAAAGLGLAAALALGLGAGVGGERVGLS